MLNLVIHLLKNKIVSFYNIAIVASPSVGNPTHVITDALLYAMRLLRNHLPYVYDTAAYKVPNTCSYRLHWHKVFIIRCAFATNLLLQGYTKVDVQVCFLELYTSKISSGNRRRWQQILSFLFFFLKARDCVVRVLFPFSVKKLGMKKIIVSTKISTMSTKSKIQKKSPGSLEF